MLTLEEFKRDGHWEEALRVSMPQIAPVINEPDVPLEHFAQDDVVELIKERTGENDGDSWLAVVRLQDGRYAFVSAWCDYTGWGCQDGGFVYVARSVDALIQFGMTPEEKAALGY